MDVDGKRELMMGKINESHSMTALITEAVFVGSRVPIADAFVIYQMTYNWKDQVRADIIRRIIVFGQIKRSVTVEKSSVCLMRPI